MALLAQIVIAVTTDSLLASIEAQSGTVGNNFTFETNKSDGALIAHPQNVGLSANYYQSYLWCQLRDCQNYSKSSPDCGRVPAAGGALASRQKRLDFGPRRRPRRTADAAAFDAGDRRAKAHRLDLAAAFGQRQGEAAMEGVAGGERVDGVDGKHRQAAKFLTLQK